MFVRFVGLLGFIAVVSMASLLSVVIIRNPQTHDNLSNSLQPDYFRTSLDSVVQRDLATTLADLPAFPFPEPGVASAAASGEPTAPSGREFVVAGDGANSRISELDTGTSAQRQVGGSMTPVLEETQDTPDLPVLPGVESGQTHHLINPPPHLPAGVAPESAESRKTETQSISVIATEYAFEPGRIEAKAKVPVELHVKNEGEEGHGIWLPDFGIKGNIRAFKSHTFSFTPDAPGRYQFECSDKLCGTDEEHNQMTGFILID